MIYIIWYNGLSSDSLILQALVIWGHNTYTIFKLDQAL